jgi:hypothetical protein
MITALLDTIRQPLDSLMGIGQARAQTCVVNNSSHLADEPSVCQAVVLASLLRALTADNLYPLPKPDQYEGSVITLLYRLEDVVSSIKALESEPGPPPQKSVFGSPNPRRNLCTNYNHCQKCREAEESSDHSGCNPKKGLIDELNSEYRRLPAVIDQTHIAHLDAQAAKTRMLSS